MSEPHQGPVWDADRQRWAYDTTIGQSSAYVPAVPPPPLPSPPAAPSPDPSPDPSPAPAAGPPPAADSGRRGTPRRARLILAAAVAVAVLGGGVTALAATGNRPSWLGGSPAHKPSSAAAPAPSTSAPGGTASAQPTTIPSTGPATTTPTTGPTTTGPATQTPTPGTGPIGYTLRNDPAGFTLRVPDGWQRTTNKGQIYYSPDNLEHLLQIGVNPADGTTPLDALRQIDTALSARPHYQRVSLQETPTASGDAATLEYTYTNTTFGSRHAIDRAFFSADGGTLYFLLAAGPVTEWPATLTRFTIAATDFCQTTACPTTG